MAAGEPRRQGKRERREQRRLAARRRVLRTRVRLVGILAMALAAPALWAFERSGPRELAEAEVTGTRHWRHTPKTGRSHRHTAAMLRIEGLDEATVDRAPDYVRGQRVPVWIRRGRLSGWPHFLALAQPAELEPGEGGAAAAP